MHSLTPHATQDYLYPLGRAPHQIYHDIHQELAVMRHAELLKEQAHIQRFVRTNPMSRDTGSRERSLASTYEREVRSKQQRIAAMLRHNASVESQQSQLRRILFDEQLSYKNMLQQMQMDQYHLLSSRKTARLNSYKPRPNILTTLDNIHTNTLISTNGAGDTSNRLMDGTKVCETFEAINIKQNWQQYNSQKEKLLRQYEKNRCSNRPAVDSVLKFGQKQKLNFNQGKSDAKQTQSLDLDSKKRSHSAQQKRKNRVSFDLSSNIVSIPHSQQPLSTSTLNPQQLNYSQQPPIHQPNQQDTKSNAQTKIQNRIMISQSTYRDSQLRNIKHQTLHLASTYHNELKLRHALKMRINNTPIVIDRYRIVVEPL